MSARRPPSLPPEIPGFSYVELLGSGGFADVFLYEQRMPRRRVAIKVLLPETLSAGARESFDAEANLMAQLSTHPSIVTIYQADIAADGRPYLAMEYCSRPNLGARYRREKISVSEALRIGIQVAGAVETSHRAGILHRDIKPANILVTEYNRPALTDFGISVALVGGAESESVGMSIPWSPPEVFDDARSSGAAADIYSLGATIYTLLAGRSPFELPGGANSGLELISRIQSAGLLPTGRPDVPESLEAVLRVAMARRTADRYSSALEFARALQKIQLELSLSVTPADVLDESLPATADEEEDDGNTRIRGIVTIDPAGPPTTGRPAGTPSQGPVDMTVTVARSAVPAVGAAATTFSSGPPSLGAAPTTSASTGAVPPIGAPPGHPPLAAAGAGSAPTPAGASTSAGISTPAEETIRRSAAEPAPTQRTIEAPASRKRLPIVLGAAAVVVILVVVGIVFAVNAGTGSPAAETTQQADAPVAIAPAETVAAPTNLVGQPGAAGIVFTWTNPAPKTGDVFLWATVTPGTDPQLAAISTPTVTVPAPASGQVCIEVSVRRTDGHASDPVTKCAP
ncbi:MAG: serine/threonine protein kinase [Subtercola sp.]|nr:serine/threonine protein kinase [Subtercola sp.]